MALSRRRGFGRMARPRPLLLVALALIVSCATVDAANLSGTALRLVVDACSADSAVTSLPAPCLKVVRSPDGGYVVLREPFGLRRTILSPIAAIPGIEDPRLLAPNAPNFFAMAWQERGEATGAPSGRDGWIRMALAINSPQSRTQDQLHIHIACVKPVVAAALAKAAARIGTGRFRQIWFARKAPPYWVERIKADSLAGHNPLQLVAHGVPGAERHMDEMTIAVVGAWSRSAGPGFWILATQSNPRIRFAAEAEGLLDRGCRAWR
ncbi:CDP-diacylglycerol diphosphatase [Jiella sp. M17.18]|uniref:CDP-diacylglycerol diphosphatase n=1 Tax=Jiella sp. M17.18 TaxID=3234247 RepID=UPI0034DF569B